MEDSSWSGWTTPPPPQDSSWATPRVASSQRTAVRMARRDRRCPGDGRHDQVRLTHLAAGAAPRIRAPPVVAGTSSGHRGRVRPLPRQPAPGRPRGGRRVLRGGRPALVPAPGRPVAGAEPVDGSMGAVTRVRVMAPTAAPDLSRGTVPFSPDFPRVPFRRLGTPGLGAGGGSGTSRSARRSPTIRRAGSCGASACSPASVRRRRKASAPCAGFEHRGRYTSLMPEAGSVVEELPTFRLDLGGPSARVALLRLSGVTRAADGTQARHRRADTGESAAELRPPTARSAAAG